MKKVLRGDRGRLVSVTGPSVFVNCFLFKLDSIFPPRWEVRGTVFLGAYRMASRFLRKIFWVIKLSRV